MKNKILAIALCSCLIFSLFSFYEKKAYADPFTASQLGSLSYALMESWGINFAAGNATGAAMNDFMAQNVENYVNSHGGSIADLFIGDMAVDAAGKLVVGQQLYNSVVNFYGWLKERYDISDVLSELTEGTYNGASMGDYTVDKEEGGEIPASGVGMSYSNWVTKKYTVTTEGFDFGQLYNGGVVISTNPGKDTERLYTGNYSLHYDNQIVYALIGVIRWTMASPYEYFYRANVATAVTALDNSLSWNMSSDYVEPTVLNPDKAWTGTIGGYSEPDTNLDQLLGDISQAVADNNLVVDGEVIDIPVPPEPVPTWTPVDDVIDGINQTGEMLEGIGNDIGDISGHLDDIGDQVDGLEQSLEGVQEGIETQTGVISGAIDQATSDVVDAIGEQTATLDQTLTETAEGVQDIVDVLQSGDITPKKFDLSGLFPFCIPFDIHNLLQKFDAEPVAPHVQLPFVIDSIGFSYMIDLDFSAFDTLAAAVRSVEYIVFAIGLAWATSKVIKW